MTELFETYRRWEPIPDLPELPIGAVRFSYDGHRLTITAAYAQDPSNRILRLDFHPRAFKAYEEQSDLWMEEQPPQPELNNPELNTWVWPVQEIRNSKWVQRIIARDGGIDEYPWRHFVIVSGDKVLHVMAGQPDVVELI
jgi:hypothetical protein